MRNQRLSRYKPTPLYSLVLLSTGTLMMSVSGCKREEIHSYRVPREESPAFTASQGSEQTQSAHPEVAWTAPESWQEIESGSSARVATFKAANGLEIAVTSFPGDVGGLVANVNRWRGQVGLESTDEQGVNDMIQRLEGVDVITVDLLGTDARLVGTIINVGDGKTWFAKAMGPAASVGEVKEELIAFSVSFHLHEHNHAVESQSPGSGPASANTSRPPASEPLDWSPPPEWKLDEKASPMLMSAFFSDSGARITLTSLVGDGGGALANINRWRGQLGLDQIASLQEQPMKDLGNGAMFIDLISADESARMAASIVPIGKQTLYFKMTGSNTQVESELGRFDAFVNAVGLGRLGEP